MYLYLKSVYITCHTKLSSTLQPLSSPQPLHQPHQNTLTLICAILKHGNKHTAPEYKIIVAISPFLSHSHSPRTKSETTPFLSHSHSPHTTSETTPSFSPWAGSLELGLSAPNANQKNKKNRGVLTISIQLQSKRGRGHLTGWGYQCQRWRGGTGSSRDANNFVPSCPIGMFFPVDL